MLISFAFLLFCIGMTISFAQDKHESCSYWASIGEVRYDVFSVAVFIPILVCSHLHLSCKYSAKKIHVTCCQAVLCRVPKSTHLLM